MAKAATPAKAFASVVSAARKKADAGALATALGDICLAKAHSRAKAAITRSVASAQEHTAALGHAALTVKPRRTALRRRGRNMAYTTGKPNDARYGTFRHYMIALAQRHNATFNALGEHANCAKPEWAGNKIDFAWMLAHGYICAA